MRISHIINETTSAGGIASVAQPLGSMIKRPNPSIYKKKKKLKNSIHEGEERSIIQDAAVNHIVNMFRGDEYRFDSKQELEYGLYLELESLDVEDLVNPDMEVGGQRIGDFASGRVIDVIDSSSAIDDAMSRLDTSHFDVIEGKSPHKKGTKKYKKHMAAMHAG